MFGGLKVKIGGGTIDKAVDKFAPALNEHLDKIKTLKPTDVKDDGKFDSLIIAPMLLSISGASGGVTKLIPKFDDRFKTAMFHVRNELIVVDGDSVKLVEDGQSKLPKVLVEGFKKSA
jgi:RecA-family ATPase